MKVIYKFLLKRTLELSNFLYKLISFLAIKNEGESHPKHRLIGYHQFFLNNIASADRVLDIGCGNGSLTFDVAQKAKSVTGIDFEEKYINTARKKNSRSNIEYVFGDVTGDFKSGKFDVVILSNVLEHIKNRVEFMRKIRDIAPKYLIRVPMLDRDWIPLYKKELGIEWRLDLTHYIEFTRASFEKEINEAGYQITSLSVQFGEIWAVLI